MTVSRITLAIGPNTTKVEAADGVPAQEAVPSRALIPVGRTERIPGSRAARPDASFVAHLIAMAEHAPQTRAMRRETTATAHALYDRTTVKGARGYGRVLSQIA
jgi:hypothetical protein